MNNYDVSHSLRVSLKGFQIRAQKLSHNLIW
jgi:hypothetical protein